MGGIAVGLLAGAAIDAVVGDPRRGHPVAVFGSVAHRLEEVLYRDSRSRGVAFTAAAVTGTVTLGLLADRAARRYPAARLLATAAATWSVLGSRTLGAEAVAISDRLRHDDLPGARDLLTHLVSRDTRALGPDDIARAAVESVAENASDAVVAPLCWGAAAGIPGLLGYRAINTLDAMVGYRSRRYQNFGWASARLDDLANVIPARVTAALIALVGGGPRSARLTWAIARRDARRHPSPNAGWSEAAMAGALGVRLGGHNVYAGHDERRPTLGDGRPVGPGDIARAVAVLRRTTIAAVLLAAAAAELCSSRWPVRKLRRNRDERRTTIGPPVG